MVITIYISFWRMTNHQGDVLVKILDILMVFSLWMKDRWISGQWHSSLEGLTRPTNFPTPSMCGLKSPRTIIYSSPCFDNSGVHPCPFSFSLSAFALSGHRSRCERMLLRRDERRNITQVLIPWERLGSFWWRAVWLQKRNLSSTFQTWTENSRRFCGLSL